MEVLNHRRGNAYYAAPRPTDVRFSWLWAAALLCAPAGATQLFRLDATLATSGPLVVSPGAVAVGPAHVGRAVAFVNELGAGAPGSRPLVATDHAQYRIHKVEWPSVLGAPPVSPSAPLRSVEEMPVDVTHATLTLLTLRTEPQLLILPPPNGGESRLDIQANVSRCEIAQAPDASPFEFPQDQNLTFRDEVTQFNATWGTLSGDCRAERLMAAEPPLVRFYGMKLWLASDNETREIDTGTYETPVVGGVTTTVTQVLDVILADRPMLLDLPFESHLRLHASGFLAAGNLQVGPSRGNLTWGSTNQSGAMGSFAANATFSVAWAPGDQFRVQGTTVDAPPVAAGTTQGLPTGKVAWAIGGALVGAGLLVVLLRSLLAAFTRLDRDEVLDHPRRVRILDYVRKRPGVETNTVARSLGLRWPKVAYHVATLERAGHISVRRVGGRTALFAAGAAPRGREASVALLRRPTHARLHALLRKAPGQDQQALASRTGLGQSRVSRALSDLKAAGLLNAERRDGRLRYSVRPDGSN